jgi:hypothetical protein
MGPHHGFDTVHREAGDVAAGQFDPPRWARA